MLNRPVLDLILSTISCLLDARLTNTLSAILTTNLHCTFVSPSLVVAADELDLGEPRRRSCFDFAHVRSLWVQ